MSVLFFLIAGAVGVTVQEAAETHRQRVYFARRRARRYTFN